MSLHMRHMNKGLTFVGFDDLSEAQINKCQLLRTACTITVMPISFGAVAALLLRLSMTAISQLELMMQSRAVISQCLDSLTQPEWLLWTHVPRSLRSQR